MNDLTPFRSLGAVQLGTRLPATFLLLAACAPATAQAPGHPEEGPLDHAYIYEVHPDQIPPRDTVPAFIEVSGTAQVSVSADRAQIDLAVETEGETADEAARSNAARMDRVIQALRGSDFSNLVIETHGYGLQPRYRRPASGQDPSPEIDRYRAVNNVRVTLTQIERVGELLDAAIGAGANRVSSLRFDARDTEPARLEALRGAVEQAEAQAQAIASALGVRLGPPLEVRGGAQAPTPPLAMAATRAMAMEAAPTPIEPAEQTVTASVTIRYAIERVAR